MQGTGKTAARTMWMEWGGRLGWRGRHGPESAHLAAGPGPLLLALVLVLVGCESHFVDHNPPEISLLPREQVLKVVDAPLVYGLIFDLHIPDATECSRIKARLAERFRAALLPAGRVGQEMPAQDISPGCVQLNTRRLNLGAYDEQVRAAEARFGAGRVKPLLLYFNNVELPPSGSLQSDFFSIRNRSSGVPLLWALSTPEATQGLYFDQTAAWSYSSDPGLTTRLEETARTQLPLIELEPTPKDGYALFTADELSWVLEFKGCTRMTNLTGTNFTYGTQAVRVDKARPPRFQLKLPPQPPGPFPRNSTTLKPQTYRFELEVCRAHCERLYSVPPDGELVAWHDTPRCLLKGSP